MPQPLTGFLQAKQATSGGGAQVSAILDAVRHHLGMEIAFASRYVEGRRQFTHVSSDLALPLGPGDSEPVEESYCWHILRGRLPELIHNAADLPFARTIPITTALPVGCHLNVPLRLSDGTVYGSFCCLSRTEDYSLTDRDLMTMRAFAELAAVQIEEELKDNEAREVARERILGVIAAGGPQVHLQPIHDLATGQPVGAEALARFPGSRGPEPWFREADALGLGVALGSAAAEAAIAALPYVPAPLYLAVNASPELILTGALEALVENVAGGRLVIEITEHEAVADYIALRSALAPIKDHARIAIDDVGAGYSGLRHILDLGPDILKLDMSLTRDVDRDAARRALIGAMVRFAEGLGAGLVAEGVEREGERAVLCDLGVGAAQGWHFSRAMPPVAACHYLSGAASAAPSTSSTHAKARSGRSIAA
jgi:EAL domain-containing protein (putative c-di-GMP-specific phosphodiesterase class I)